LLREEIYAALPHRTPGVIQVQYSTKLKKQSWWGDAPISPGNFYRLVHTLRRSLLHPNGPASEGNREDGIRDIIMGKSLVLGRIYGLTRIECWEWIYTLGLG
jgi:hypothetical protein